MQMYRIALAIILFFPLNVSAQYYVSNSGVCIYYYKQNVQSNSYIGYYTKLDVDPDTNLFQYEFQEVVKSWSTQGVRLQRYEWSVAQGQWQPKIIERTLRPNNPSPNDIGYFSDIPPGQAHPVGCVPCDETTKEWVSTSNGYQCMDKCPDDGYHKRDTEGNCNYCESGNWTLGNVCLPYCQHGTGQPVGSLYAHETGVCVPPPCTEDEHLVSASPMEGEKCVPNCHPDRYNVVTGMCDIECPEGKYSTAEDTECLDIPDCGVMKQWNPSTKECEWKPSCGENMDRSLVTGECECEEGYVKDTNNPDRCRTPTTEEENKPDDDEHNQPNNDPQKPQDTANPDLPSSTTDPSQGTSGLPHNPDADGDHNPDDTNPDSEGNSDGTKTGYWGTADKPVITNAQHKWGVEKRVIDFKPMFDMEKEIMKTDIGKVITKLSEIVDKLVSSPGAPVFNFSIMGRPLVIDLNMFNPIAEIFRNLMSVLIWFGLIFIILRQWRLL